MPSSSTYDPVLDGPRLRSQHQRIEALMADGRWRTLAAVVAAVGAVSEAGVSARLRELRQPKHGGYRVEHRRVLGARGLWEYRVLRQGQLALPETEAA